MNTSWTVPRSPHDLVQEHYPGEPWKVLVCCLCLNQTTRKQLDRVIEPFFERWPEPEEFLRADIAEVSALLHPLGFHNRRPAAIRRMTEDFVRADWKRPEELHGVGKYAADAYRIFIEGDWRDVVPDDHALNDYRTWLANSWARETEHGSSARCQLETRVKMGDA